MSATVRPARLAAFALLAGALLLPACATKSVVVTTPYAPDAAQAPPSGIVYWLPRTQLEVAIPYTVQWETIHDVDENGERISVKSGPTRRARVKQPIGIRPVSVADGRMGYRIDPERLSALNVSVEKAELELTPDGLFQGVNLELEDRTAEIITGVVGSAIRVARIAAIAGREETEVEEIETVTVVRLLDLDDPELEDLSGSDGFLWEYSDHDAAREQLGLELVDEVTVQLGSTVDLGKLSTMSSSSLPRAEAENGKAATEGLVVRVPGPVRTKVLVDGIPVLDRSVTFAQAGGITWVPLSSKLFTDRTFGLAASAETGGVTSFRFSSTSAGERAVTKAGEVADSVVEELETREIDAIDREIERLNAERRLIEARRALEEAKEEDEGGEADR
jgi:hypothetical protein